MPGCRRVQGDCQDAASQLNPWHNTGRLTRVAGLIMEVLKAKGSPQVTGRVRDAVLSLTARFPLPV